MSYYSYNNGGGFFSSIPPVTKNIIIINVLVWIMAELRPDFMYETFSLFYPTSPFFKPWQIVTHMFMHGGFWHIFFNMYTLFIFGCVLERMWGPKKFLLFYFVTGLGAALLHTGVQAVEMQVYMSQAAEGSVSAVQAVHALKMTPTVGVTLIFPPVSLKAKWFVIIFAVIELVTGIFGMGGGVAHFAHLGGMLFGWLLIMYWKKKHTLYNYR